MLLSQGFSIDFKKEKLLSCHFFYFLVNTCFSFDLDGAAVVLWVINTIQTSACFPK